MFVFKKHILRLILCIVLVIAMNASCLGHIVNSYPTFQISNVTGYTVDDYVTNDKLDSIRIGNVAVVPTFKEVRHGVFVVFITAYSHVSENPVILEGAELLVDGNSILDRDISKVAPLEYRVGDVILLEENSDGIYEGYVAVGIFSDEFVDISNGQKLALVLQLRTEGSTETVVKNIRYDITIEVGKTIVTPV